MMARSSRPLSVVAGLVLALLCLPFASQATHNRAGEIIVEQVGECRPDSRQVKATVITYTRTSSVDADRDTLTICWGDGNCQRVARSNGFGIPPRGEPLENDIKRNFYIAFHTYSGFGTYRISMTDPNRNAGILNVNYPFSVNIRFHLETIFTLSNPVNSGCNSTPILNTPPINFGCVGHPFTHNPGAEDPDRDSLAYVFTVPLQGQDSIVPNYRYPNEISPGPNNQLTINPVTGDILWLSPVQPGEYNLAFFIISYREGIAIDTMLRDMQIIIEDCDNEPPTLDIPNDEICVIAGELVQFPVTAGAPVTDMAQLVKLVAYGGPFGLPDSPAEFLPNNENYSQDPLVRTFRWQTTCDHISDQPYNVVFRAVDNFLGDTVGSATLKTVRIKVVGPPPQDVEVEGGSGQVELFWELPYECENTSNEYFRGFTIWRRVNSNQFTPDECMPGLAGRGYTKITPQPIRSTRDGRYYFLDTGVERGRTYCYRILANFARQTAGGLFFYNAAESLPSEEACVQLNRDLPVITQVDVLTTDPANGAIELCWVKPLAADLDTVQNPGPYRYVLRRAAGITTNAAAFQPMGVEFSSTTFAGLSQSCYLDQGLNTAGTGYSYIVDFYVNGESQPLGQATPASSVFLGLAPTDNAMVLNWQESVPWDNYAYDIFRRNDSGGLDSLTTITDQPYRDTGLINGLEYCYLVRAVGAYGVPGIPSPLLNRSQLACARPFDNVPPCPPTLQVESFCDRGIDCQDQSLLFNTLRWINPMQLCPETDDVTGYRLYYSQLEGGAFTQIGEINEAGVLTFDHQPPDGIAGCYAVTAIDTFFNESAFSNVVCVDNCPLYRLPNAFTPNGDNQNDLFVPTVSCFVASVDFQIFNRWGQLVFSTHDPQLNWNGANLNGEALEQSTYYYRCQVFEQRVGGIVPSPELLSGYIELLRGPQ